MLLAVFVLSLGKSDSQLDPSAANASPSGLRAGVELLRQESYKVSINRDDVPKLDPKQLLVLTRSVRENPLAAIVDDTTEDTTKRKDFQRIKAFKEFLGAGGRVLLLPFPTEFANLSRSRKKLQPTTLLARGSNQRFSASIGETYGADLSLVDPFQDSFMSDILTTEKEVGVLFYESVGKGALARFTDPTIFCNRYISDLDHASLWLATVRALSKGSKDVVVYEGYIRSADKKGLLEMIGAWAVAGWYQALFLLAILLWSLNVRFGLPEEKRAEQRSSRELVDALGFTMQRGRQSTLASEALAKHASKSLHLALRAPKDANIKVLLDQTSPTVKKVFEDLMYLTLEPKATPAELISANQKWETEFARWKIERTLIAPNG